MADTFEPSVIRAILWDFDGTLVETRVKNFNVTRAIVESFNLELGRTLLALQCPEEYERCQRKAANWRDFYRRYLGFDEEQTDVAGKMWTDFQLKDRTSAPAYPGLAEALRQLSGYPQGIVSQNARPIIEKILADLDLLDLFGHVVGYAEVPIRRQKPEPDGLLLCLERLAGLEGEGTVLYIGDHPTDFETAHKANLELKRTGRQVRICSVAAAYGANGNGERWKIQPDRVAQSPGDILRIRQEIESQLSAAGQPA